MRILSLVALTLCPVPLCASIDAAAAGAAFQEANAICERDAGKLWGISLCGPIVFVDPPSRDYRTSTGETGNLPKEYNIANTSFEWKGSRWTMVSWPLPQGRAERESLLLHELWHRVQGQLGLDAPNNSLNNHLDTADGRTLLQLEWRALTAALESSGDARAKVVGDAVAFRRQRRSLFPNATKEETALEITEGLAEYTGIRLSSEPRRLALESLRGAPLRNSFVRSFAYASGPAWGLLLDDAVPGWRKRVTLEIDLASLLGNQPVCSTECLSAAAKRYGGDELRDQENLRAAQNRERLGRYRAVLVDGPTLTLPMQGASIQFNPGNLVPLEPYGTVYSTLRVSAAWGTLELTDSIALISSDFSTVRVPAAPTGYTLELKEGWEKHPAGSSGSVLVQHIK